MYQQYRDRAAFLFIYIQEAHPEDGWQMESNLEDDVIFNRARSLEERREVAGACCQRLDLSMPVVVDRLDNPVDDLYCGWPERLVVVDRDGRVAYISGPGPWGFKPQEAEKALRKCVGS